MKSESDASDYITEFVSGGTKNYGYVTKHGKTCCKVRRFTLNYRESQRLQYDIMEQNVSDDIQWPLDERRTIPIVNPCFSVHEPAIKKNQDCKTRQTVRISLWQASRR